MSAQAGGQGLASRRWEHGLLHVQGDPQLVVSKRSQDGTLQRREDLALIKAKESALRALNVFAIVDVSMRRAFWHLAGQN